MMRAPIRNRVIVTLTPMAIRNDSRTFKQANSVARLGYRSIVIEGPPSKLDAATLSFDLISSLSPPKPVPVTEAKPTVPVLAPAADPAAVANTIAGASEPCLEAMERRESSHTAFRKRLRSVAELGGNRTVQVSWRCEQKIKRLLNRFARDPIGTLGLIIVQVVRKLTWPARYIVQRLISLFRRARARLAELRVSHSLQFMRHVREYLRLYALAPVKVTPKADLYYLHAFYQFPAVWWLCLRHRAKFIYDAHDFYSHMDVSESLSPFWRDWVRPFENWIERKCARRAAALVTVNEGIARLMEQRFERSVTVLRNAHDPRLEQPVERTVREVARVAPEAFLAVCVGQWKRDTAIAQAVAAFAELPDTCHLAFVGGGFPSYAELLARHGVTGRVHFLPPVAPTEVVPFIRSADVGLLLYSAVSPSIENCLPNGFFQPLAAGLPILYPGLPEIRRLAEHYRLGLQIDPLDPKSIAGQLRELTDGANQLAGFRRNVELARPDLSWECDELNLRDLLEATLEGRVSHSKSATEGAIAPQQTTPYV